ncbi:hypothetical protein ACN47E_005661 [Coniothyrium glycines]
MSSLLLLPDELLLAILTEAARVRSVKRALRLKLVCKAFANMATTAIFDSKILNCREMYPHMYRTPDFWAEYFAYLVLAPAHRKSQEWKILFRIAQHICHYRCAVEGICLETVTIADNELRECVVELCRLVHVPSCDKPVLTRWPAAACADEAEVEVDESTLDFRRHLISAAAWLGEKRLVIKLLGEGCNWFGGHVSMFTQPIRAASYRGHIDIVKLLMVDDSLHWKHELDCPTLIINYFNDHPGLLDLTLGSSWDRCEIAPRETNGLQYLALNETCNGGTFKRLLKIAKSYMVKHDPKWFSRRTYYAAMRGETDIVKYLIEEEGLEVSDHRWVDESIFLSRDPVEFLKPTRIQYRPMTYLSLAARGGYEDTVKVLLEAGAKADHEVEFAALCGSRTLVRLLWERSGNDAVQGAFKAAIDREDTAMFNLLRELGAKVDDDVRVALIDRAQGEGLESMVRLLDHDSRVSAANVS